jgi:hypothetical protein
MTKEKSPAVQWYPKQYLGDDKVLAMEWDARGMHHWLLNISWQQEPRGTIPNDTGLIRRWLGSPSDEIWRRVWPQIKESWLLQDGRFVNAGMLRAAQRQEAYSKRRTKDGKSPEDEEGLFVDFDFELVSQQIYELYPRKVKKPEGITAIKKALARETKKLGSVETAVVYLKVQTEKYERCPFVKAKKSREEDRFIPHPATWYNSEAYDDEQDWGRSSSEVGAGTALARAGKCKEHPDSGAAVDGSCWGCYTAELGHGKKKA